MMLVRTMVRPSAIHGLGLFAVQPIPKGTAIWRFVEGFDQHFTAAQVFALPEIAQEHARWFGFVRPTDRHLVLSGDHACFMNHSPDPNTGAPPPQPDSTTTVALRDIRAGEEITCNYFEFDAEAARKLTQTTLTLKD